MQTMMKIAGGSSKFNHECSLDEFIKQSQEYRDLDQDNLNQIYKFLMYSGIQGMMLSHPFPVDRLQYIQQWYNSPEYQRIKNGDYTHSAVDVETTPEDDVDILRRQIEELQQEINRRRSGN
jgi:hypothetical protein